MKKYVLAPSVLSANFLNLEADLDKCLDHGVEWIHYDVMDFHFVPNLTFGSKILQDIKAGKKQLKVDIHFMVEIKQDYDYFFEQYLKAKPKMMTMHLESLKNKKNVEKFIKICRENNVLASIAISPKTPVKKLLPYLKELDNVLIMSVEPGFGGQSFIPSVVSKIEFLNQYRQENNLNYQIEVDGGINGSTVELVKKAGVDMIVAGSYFFGSKNVGKVIKEITGDEK